MVYIEGAQRYHGYFALLSNEIKDFIKAIEPYVENQDPLGYGLLVGTSMTSPCVASLVENGGEFKYSVHNFTGRSGSTSTALFLSNATLRISVNEFYNASSATGVK